MSEGDATVAAVAPVLTIVEENVPLTLETALPKVLTQARYVDGLARGLRETVRAMDTRKAHFVVLAEDISEPAYTKLIEALAAEHNIPLIKVPEQKKLGEFVGLVRYDSEKNPRKVVRCSSVAVKNYGIGSSAADFIAEHVATLKKKD